MATKTQNRPDPVMLEYIFTDHFNVIRSKTKIVRKEINSIDDLEPWYYFNFHKWNQTAGIEKSVLLDPVAIYPDPFRGGKHLLVLCQNLSMDKTPHYTNHRAKAAEILERAKDSQPQFGIEQEYMIFQREFALHEGQADGKPMAEDYCEKQRIPYGWLGHNNPGGDAHSLYFYEPGGAVCFGREIAEEHANLCLKAGLEVAGINSEGVPSQWEYQISVCDGIDVADQIILSRYILHRVSEKYNAHISFLSKPYRGYFPSGMHTNFSTKEMREGTEGKKGIEYVEDACKLLCEPENHKKHIEEYGDNAQRLVGHSYSPGLDESKWGKCQKDVAIRIPEPTVLNEKGYLEDRRPACDANPYKVIARLVQTVVLKE